ncbi:hypothetical protein QMK33_01400 [Hymenobacter sp. H14-R3]|uniref:hypothetical protein n=1 Tax=Hymenobacter sp. H14-R3 TaxID=3046308 RepID=UPI0024BB203A|nr:hypothetical protein [Hymenobacter sp. H14-R3]MDJ0363790.1 hypothetical protein [Hymenobacter sp. H14-R3]
MKKYFFLLVALVTLASQPATTAAQQLAKPVYMQVFYAGTGWLAGQPLLHYSPAFRGKTQELVQEDSTRFASPGALLFNESAPGTVYQGTMVSVTSSKGTLVPDGKGKMRPQTPADIKKDQQAEKAQFSRSLNLLNARATLAFNTLTNSLNEAAADGWEVVQVAAMGNEGGLVYLLRRR